MIQLYLILALASFLGFIFGMILAKIAPEELDDNAPWSIRIQDFLFLVMVVLLGYHNLENYAVIVLLVMLPLYWFKDQNSKLLEYAMLGVLFGIAYFTQAFNIFVTLLFVYTIASGNLMAQRLHKISFKRMFKEVSIRLIFFLIGALLPFYLTYF